MNEIRRIAVLGAGTMGAQIAAHAANAQVPCVLLDRVPPASPSGEGKTKHSSADRDERNRFAKLGLDRALKARPPAFFAPEGARLVSTGNFEDDLSRVSACDWIIEAVTEDLGVKRRLLERVRPLIAPGAIISSNTSGISIGKIANGFDDDFRRRWLGTHFFNPPRYMKLLEIIPTPDTLPEVVDGISRFAEDVLGKGVVRAKDRPNFIANRIGVFVHLLTLEIMQEEGLTVDEVDALTGPAIGLPKSATFRTVDLVGLDVMAHVVRNLYESLSGDEERERFHIPDFMTRMMERNLLGEKTRQGFYKRTSRDHGGESEIFTLDLSSFEYRPRQKPQFASLEMAKTIEDTRQRVKALFESSDRAGRFYRKLWPRTFHYVANRIPEISDDLVSVDRALQWGFNWECGVFELWDALGVEKIAAEWRAEGVETPPLVDSLLRGGKKAFYADDSTGKSVFDSSSAAYVRLEERPGVVRLASVRSRAGEIRKNAGASLIDLGEGVVCLEFHSKMNTIGPDVIEMIHAGLRVLDENFDAIVIANDSPNFSAGANLMLVLLSIQEGEWDEIDQAVRSFQNANMALKYAGKPVVAAPRGLTLGGAAETSLHCARRVATAETYMGLVETGVGLIPAGGGVKEMIIRATDSAVSDEDLFLRLRDVFQNIGMAKVSTSAAEARRLRYLSPSDVITMNRDHQLATAKRAALDLVKLGYRPAAPRDDVLALGEPAFAKMNLALHLMRRAEYISDYDLEVGTILAKVLSGGGEFTAPQRVSEGYLLGLERESFLSLCGRKRTAERIQHMLRHGKPLRN
ncbi:MAG: 3-hydroxyacyl-CoA dehydrogenase NAD-binding domain-containing protein [Terriglobia bacterium]